MKARIVILSAFLSPHRSGAEACAEEIPLELRDRYDFTIITARMSRSLPKREMLRGTVPIIRVGLGFPFDKWLYPFLAPFAALKLRPTIIHAVLESFAGLAMFFCCVLFPRTKRILTCQSTNTTFLVGFMHKFPHKLTVISRLLAERAEKFGRRDAILIPNGLHIRDIPERDKIPGRILFVGRLRPMKGVDTLLRAFANLPQSAHLRIAGEGELESWLKEIAIELRISERVQFLGYIPTPAIYEEFAQAEIFCGLSRHEALGNVFLEAEAAECAIVGTNIEGIPEVVEHGKSGFLVPPDDVLSATEALRKLLTDKELRQNFAKRGKEIASQYDWSILALKYADLYETLL